MTGPDSYPDVVRRMIELSQRRQSAAMQLIASAAAGRLVDPHSLEWARDVVAQVKPLGRALGNGVPTP